MVGLLARLGDTSIRVNDTRLDGWARVACTVAIVLYVLHALYAVATHRALYGDAAWFLLRMITEGGVTSFYTDFSQDFYYSRFVAYALTQLPALAALHLGLDEARQASWILGATYFAHKPLSLWLCYRLLPVGTKSYVLFPLLGLFAGSINSEIYIVTETHLAASFFWPMLLAVTQLRHPSRAAFAAIAGGLLLSAFVYESMAFFGPLLLFVCAIRAGRTPREQRPGWILLSAFSLVPIIISWAAILFPRDPTNKSAFSNGVMKLLSDTTSGVTTAHVLGVASILSLVAVVAVLGWALRSRHERALPLWAWGVAMALALLPATHFMLNANSVDFTHAITDRGFGGLMMQLAVIGLYLLVVVLPARIFRAAVPGAMVVVSGLAIGQIAWQLLATHAWHNAIARLETVLARNEGLESCSPGTLSGPAKAQPAPAQILCHWWVLPLSVVLAQDSRVQTLLLSQESFLPFDPRVPHTFPNTLDGDIDYRPYLNALNEESTSGLPVIVDFTDSGNGYQYVRTGFSSPEAWATWTDGRVAKLELCFGAGAHTPSLAFKLAPQVTTVRPRLGVAVDVNGASVAAWAFRLGEGIVEREIAIPRSRLDGNGCAVLGFRFDDDRRASEIGVPGDPRRLGLAFLSMQTRYEH